MPDYKKGKIYKIINDELEDLVYIGSTVQSLSNRLCEHRKHSRNENINLTSQLLFAVGKPKIILIQDFPCNNKKELEQRERYYIENTKCVNKNIPCRTRNEYYIDNREQIIEKTLKYYFKNYEHINNKRKEKIKCDCGREITKSALYNHKNSKIHKTIINEKREKYKIKIQKDIMNYLNELTFEI